MKSSTILKVALIALLATSCVANRQYTYIETAEERELFGGTSTKEKDAEIIMAKSDTLAYIEAFTKFCISEKVYRDVYKKGWGEYASVPKSFKLLNELGEDITNIEFATKKQEEEIISAKYLTMENYLDGLDEKDQDLAASKVDSVKMQELLPYFNVKKDEFDPNGTVWYTPKSAPKYTNANGIYLYFGVQNNKPMALRFRIQYYAADWLFFSKVQFSIDGNAYEFIPLKTETDHSGGVIWEWFDESLTSSDSNLIHALASAKTAKMKFIGRQYYDIKTITAKQTKDINRALELYNAMGGNY